MTYYITSEGAYEYEKYCDGITSCVEDITIQNQQGKPFLIETEARIRCKKYSVENMLFYDRFWRSLGGIQGYTSISLSLSDSCQTSSFTPTYEKLGTIRTSHNYEQFEFRSYPEHQVNACASGWCQHLLSNVYIGEDYFPSDKTYATHPKWMITPYGMRTWY